MAHSCSCCFIHDCFDCRQRCSDSRNRLSETIVSIPIINGGIIATQIMTSAAMDKGFAMAAALGTVLYAVQKFVGTPVASYFGLRAAKEALA